MPIHLAQASLATLLPQGQLQSQPVAASGTGQTRLGRETAASLEEPLNCLDAWWPFHPLVVFDSLCGRQIKPGKLPIFTGSLVVIVRITDKCGLSYDVPGL